MKPFLPLGEMKYLNFTRAKKFVKQAFDLAPFTLGRRIENPTSTEREIRKYIRGNTCRCTGYTQIVEAIEDCKCPPEEV